MINFIGVKQTQLKIAHWRERFHSRGVILMYHSVAEIAVDPWELAVTPENFRAQMEALL